MCVVVDDIDAVDVDVVAIVLVGVVGNNSLSLCSSILIDSLA